MENREHRRRILNHLPILEESIYVLCMMLVIYCSLSVQIHIWKQQGIPYCMLDCLHIMERPYIFGVFFIPITLWKIVKNAKIYKYPAFVVLHVQSEKLWKKQFVYIIKQSLWNTVVYSAVTCLFSSLASYDVNNWDIEFSIFYLRNGTVYTGKTWWIIIGFIACNFLKTLLLCASFFVIEEVSGNSLPGCLLIMGAVVVEWVKTNCRVFFNLYCISPENFSVPKKFFALAGFLVLWNVLLFYVGHVIWKRKEFYYAA